MKRTMKMMLISIALVEIMLVMIMPDVVLLFM